MTAIELAALAAAYLTFGSVAALVAACAIPRRATAAQPVPPRAPDMVPIPLEQLLAGHVRRPVPAQTLDDLELAFARPAVQPLRREYLWHCAGCRDRGFLGGCTRCGRVPVRWAPP